MIRVAYRTELPAKRADVPQVKGSDLPAAGEQIQKINSMARCGDSRP